MALAFLVAAALLAGAAGGLRAGDFDALRDGCVNRPQGLVAPTGERTGLAPWDDLQSIEETRGLVYRDLRADGQPILRAFYLAFFELEFTLDDARAVRRVRFCSGDDELGAGT